MTIRLSRNSNLFGGVVLFGFAFDCRHAIMFICSHSLTKGLAQEGSDLNVSIATPKRPNTKQLCHYIMSDWKINVREPWRFMI